MSGALRAPVMKTLAEILTKAAKALTPVTETPRLDAELLLAHSLAVPRSKLLTRLQEPVPATNFDTLLQRRLAHEPLAYIFGEWEFFSLPLYVESPLLVPRPETEHLVEAVVEFIGHRNARILDLCTGTGCVAIAIAKHAKHAQVTAVDINPKAIEVTAKNAQRHNVLDRVASLTGDLFDALPNHDQRFDAISANPPYVAEAEWEGLDPVIRLHEDPRALKAGSDGLKFIRLIAEQAPRCLQSGGLLALEIGDGQSDAVRAILAKHHYEAIAFRRDLAGIERIALARKP